MQRFEFARVWRLFAVGAVALLIVMAATSDAAFAGTSRFAAHETAPAAFKAVVSLTPSTVAVGQKVTSQANKSTLPNGAKVKRIALNWGDHTKTVILHDLKAKASHRYVLPGRYIVVLAITDQANEVTRGDAVEVVTVPGGSFTGTNPQTGQPSMSFYVSSTKTALQDISIRDAIVTCAPGGGSVTEPVGIASVALKSNGSFSATATQHGVFEGYPATFTYTFEGNFHSLGPTGSERAAGMFRETLTYTGAAAYRCSSNNQSWTAFRDSQPAQKASPPPVGSYTGTNPQTGQPSIGFDVSSNSLQDISIPDVIVTCAPGGGSVTEPVAIASITLVKSDWSFSDTTVESGVFEGHPATFTYTFDGNFHSVGSSGSERAAGMFRATLTYTATTAYSCTSNNQSWTATFS